VLAYTSAHTANKMEYENMHSYRWLPMFQGNLMLPFFFCSENGGHKFFLNTCNHLPNCMASYPRKPKS
jgi:hypothetical protein